MLTLLRLIILRNWQSLLTLFFVTLFSGVGFITLGQLTTNIESSVASETRPLFGADLIVSVDGYTGASLHEVFAPYLSGETYTWAERHEFSTTLFDREGKTWLVQVIAYNGTYPQRGILKTEKVEKSEWQRQQEQKVSATPELIDTFATGWVITLDERAISITDSIVESSDIWFSFGTDNHLLILPTEFLSGSMLLSSGSRLDYDLLISFADERRAKVFDDRFESIEALSSYRIRNYEDRSERNLETVWELTNYILLILVVSSIFALVILRSAHDAFFDSLARTLRIVETLGFTRRRQMVLFAILYGLVLPVALILAGVIGYIILTLIARFPEAESFAWTFSPFFSSVLLLMLLVFAAFYPAWRTRWWSETDIHLLEKILSKNRYTKKFSNIWSDAVVSIIIGITVIALIFSDIVFALMVVVGGGLVVLILSVILASLYERIFRSARDSQRGNFPRFDGLRTLVRPLTPTLPITVSLVSVTTFFLVFVMFSLSFRSELAIDATESANMYALNILESDREKIEKVLTEKSEMYSILRARISKVNGRTLAEHLKTPSPSGEFTREFNITTTPLENKIIKWKSNITAEEVSVDEDFAWRLWVTVGDTVEFLLSGRAITLTIANIRESTRQGFRPFFYFSFDPEAFRTAPKTYFVSTYTTDWEAWKRLILENSWAHVTFVDVENILSIVRDISGKILSVIGLFLAVVSVFALFAVVSFFARMRSVEAMKTRLYELFWLLPESIMRSLRTSRVTLFLVSWILSVIIGVIVSSLIIRASSILSLSWSTVALVTAGSVVVYGVLMMVVRK
jgi:putative ABC transport system permease protein